MLTGKKVCDKNYEHALKVRNKLQMHKMKDYHKFWLKYDVLLLVYVFEKFGHISLKNYGLCPSHYVMDYVHIISPALIWDPMLYKTKV